MPPVLMIHGICSGGWCFENYRARFEAAGFECITPNLRLHEQRTLSDIEIDQLAELSILDYAADLEALILTLPERPIVLGHSLGGLLAQILASRGLCQASILLTSVPPKSVPALSSGVIGAFSGVVTTPGFWKKPFKLSALAARRFLFNRVSSVQLPALEAKLCLESGRVLFEAAFPWLDKRNATYVNFKKVTCPMLVIAGGEDQLTPRAVVRKIAKKYPQARYQEYVNQSHWLVGEEGWELVAGDIIHWIKNTMAYDSMAPSNGSTKPASDDLFAAGALSS